MQCCLVLVFHTPQEFQRSGRLLRFDTPRRGNLGAEPEGSWSAHCASASFPAFLHLVLDVEQHIRQLSALGQTV